MELGLTGKTALITGGSKGIGRAIADRLADEGCHLRLVARTKQDLETAKAEISARCDVNVTVHPIDLSDGETARGLAKNCSDVDILVNNAGAIPGGSLSDVVEPQWREAWDLKVFGYINLCRAYFESMTKRGHGVIVNIIGMAGERPDFSYIAGTTGNAGLMAFTRALGSRSIDNGVRVVGVNPGLVETERMVKLLKKRAQENFGDETRWQSLLAPLPLGRAANPEEVADLAVFLASARASYITGTIFEIDGGASVRGGVF